MTTIKKKMTYIMRRKFFLIAWNYFLSTGLGFRHLSNDRDFHTFFVCACCSILFFVFFSPSVSPFSFFIFHFVRFFLSVSLFSLFSFLFSLLFLSLSFLFFSFLILFFSYCLFLILFLHTTKIIVWNSQCGYLYGSRW